MTNDKPATDEAVEVTQADRDAAFAYYLFTRSLPVDDYRARGWRARLDRGERDNDEIVQAFARHRARVPDGREAGSFQAEVADWMLECFGEEIAADKIERADRFIEEALELAQTIPGFTVERARALVEYVFSRPVGERGQEVGGVGVTLAALCNTYGISINEEWSRELARVWTKVEAIRAKQATKPVGSALPVALATLSPDDKLRGALEAMCAAQRVEPYRGWNLTELNKAADHARELLGLPSVRELNPDIAAMQDAAEANKDAIRASLGDTA